jgi:uncharacterized protein YgiM (DUF1202 family)
MAEETRTVRVVKAYQSAFPDPVKLGEGEPVTVQEKKSEWEGWLWCVNREGRNGWVPEHYVSRDQNVCTMTVDYDATELSVEAGETLELHKRESGWWWCVNQTGAAGWVPEENLEIEEG